MDFLSRLLDAVAVHLEIPRKDLDAVEYAQRIADGGIDHYVASANAMSRRRRNTEIAADLNAGLSTVQVAERRGISRQQVWNIAKNSKPRQSAQG